MKNGLIYPLLVLILALTKTAGEGLIGEMRRFILQLCSLPSARIGKKLLAFRSETTLKHHVLKGYIQIIRNRRKRPGCP